MEQAPPQLNRQDKNVPGLMLLFLGIGVGIAAQVVLVLSVAGQDLSQYFLVGNWLNGIGNNSSPLAGILLYVLAGVLFVLGASILGDRQVEWMAFSGKRPRNDPRFGLWFSSIGLSGAIAFYLVQTGQDDQLGYTLVALWVLSILLFAGSVLIDQNWRPPGKAAIRGWLAERSVELGVVAILVITAFFIRFVDLEAHPYSFINDEGQLGVIGNCILQGQCKELFALEGWSGQPFLAFLPAALGIAIFGKTAIALRIVSVITGTLSILAVYLFAREVFDKKIAWVTAFLLAALPVHIQFSRLGVDNIFDSLSTPLILWLLFRGAKRGSTLSFVAAGILAGLCLYTYPGSILAPVLGVGVLLYFSARQRGFLQAQARNMLFFTLAAVIIVLPLLANLFTNSGLFTARFKGEGIFQNGMIQNEMATSGRSAAGIVISQFAKSSLVYIATPANTGFFNSPAPYLTPVAAILFILGLAMAIWRIRDARYLALLAWFAAPIILGSTLTNSPPASQRMLMSMPALMIIVALGATKVLEAGQHISQGFGRFIPVILLGLVIYIGIVNLNFYFNDYRTGHYFEDPANEFSYETRNEIVPLRDQGRFYLLADPSIFYLTFPNFQFFESDVEKSAFDTVTREALAALPRDKDALFIATPDYVLKLQQIAQWIPNGEWKEVRRRYQPTEVLYYSYKIKKEQLEGFTP